MSRNHTLAELPLLPLRMYALAMMASFLAYEKAWPMWSNTK